MQNEGVYAVIFNESLAGILGFNNMMVYNWGKSYLAKDGMQLTLKTVEALFVYSDVLEHVVVGDGTECADVPLRNYSLWWET